MNSIALVIALLLPATEQDRTRVSAHLTQDAVRVGEAFTLVISVETASTADIAIRLPSLPSSISVSGSQESSQMHFSIPGGRRRVVTRELILQASTQGNFTIPAVEIDVGGNTYRTRALRLQVTATAANNPTLATDEAWLRAIMSPETVYVGQQTTLTAEAGFSDELRLRLTRTPLFEMPAPTGFWVQEIPGGVRSELRPLEGRIVEVQVKKVAYFPLTAGRYALKPARAIVDVRQGFLFAPETREIKSASPRVTVLPLPETGKPEHFRGAVGQYDMRSSIEPNAVAVGEPVQIQLVVSGTGNIKAIAPPHLPQILGAEVFAPSEEAETRVQSEVVTGSKTFTYVIIPETDGVLRIAPITFSYFDPQRKSYRTVSTDTFEVRVRPGVAGGAETESTHTLRALRREPSPTGLTWVTSTWFLWLQLLPLLAIVALWGWQRRKPHVNHRGEYLTRVRTAAQLPDNAVYRELDHIVREAMARPGANPKVARYRGRRLLQRIETARFAPAPPQAAERARLVAETERVIKELFGRASRRTAYNALMMVALAQDPFALGVRAFDEGHYEAAVAAFTQYTNAEPHDASGWFNRGNAEYRRGERGRAIAFWATALQLAPRNQDAAHNLRITGGVEALRVRPPLAVTRAEWLLLGALLWWTTAIFVILALAKHRRLTPWLVVPLVLAMVCAVAATVAARAPRYAVALADQTPLQTEPTVRSRVVRQVRAGAVLTVQEPREEWLRVRTIDEREAWVARDDVIMVTTQR
jgi:tetratricopeptide (TPR) repeat protein